MPRQTSYRSTATGKKQAVGWNSFTQFVKKLSRDIGHIHHPKSDGEKWTKSPNKNVHGGVQEVAVTLGIGAEYQSGNWYLFDHNDEYPWDFLVKGNAWGRGEWLPKAKDVEFRELLSDASVSLSRGQSGESYVLTFFFKPVMFGFDSKRDFMEFEITVGTHQSIDPKRKTMARAESERALDVAQKHLKEFQKKTALGPRGGSSITVGKKTR